ncbi:MAG TPA: alpha-hydroxy-acid oxidizing protein [Bryobacteraceae bacterium]|nr:alpha-hydroxy-acid oxidizing protein [Bryobacteraceae bacterium]
MRIPVTRRQSLAAWASLLAGSEASKAQKLIGEPPGRIPPPQELVNASEFEATAQRKLDSLTFALISDSERGALDRITLRPRMMVDTRQMDLTAHLFGQSHFMPILAGPISQMKRFHPDGELEMARGASAAKAAMIVADHSSYPIDRIAAETKMPVWYQVYLEAETGELRERVKKAVDAGCKVLCVTAGPADASSLAQTAGIDWAAIDRLRKGIDVPVLLKGVMSPEEAQESLHRGMQGIVVSNYSPRPITGIASPIEMLPAIADAVGGKAPVLIDGSFRLGSDVFKALALGASGVLLGRPVVWGLSGYGAQGVQDVIELIQSGFARDMAMCGKINLAALDRTAVKIHRR